MIEQFSSAFNSDKAKEQQERGLQAAEASAIPEYKDQKGLVHSKTLTRRRTPRRLFIVLLHGPTPGVDSWV
jgi:hypothetical protein